MRNARGFTLIELMIVVVVIGILAAVAIPNYLEMQERAREASTKHNMHAWQLDIEGYAVDNDGIYPVSSPAAAPGGPGWDPTKEMPRPGDPAPDQAFTVVPSFNNPWPPYRTDEGFAWELRADKDALPAPEHGVASYWGDGSDYNIKGQGSKTPLSLVLTAPQ